MNDFVSDVLVALDETKENLKTQGYRIQEAYRYSNNKSIFDGFNYSQSAKIKFDYDIKKMASLIELVAKLKNPPSYLITFELKDEDECKNQVLAEAMKKAKTKAEAIASAVDMKLARCLKADFKPFEEVLTSSSRVSGRDFAMGNTGDLPAMPRMFQTPQDAPSAAENIQRTFTPEDICISETIYCLWQAESL